MLWVAKLWCKKCRFRLWLSPDHSYRRGSEGEGGIYATVGRRAGRRRNDAEVSTSFCWCCWWWLTLSFFKRRQFLLSPMHFISFCLFPLPPTTIPLEPTVIPKFHHSLNDGAECIFYLICFLFQHFARERRRIFMQVWEWGEKTMRMLKTDIRSYSDQKQN